MMNVLHKQVGRALSISHLFIFINKVNKSKGTKATQLSYQNKSNYKKVGVLPIRIVSSKRFEHWPFVQQPFYISICISTLPTQHTTFLSKHPEILGAILADLVLSRAKFPGYEVI